MAAGAREGLEDDDAVSAAKRVRNASLFDDSDQEEQPAAVEAEVADEPMEDAREVGHREPSNDLSFDGWSEVMAHHRASLTKQ